MKCLLFGALFIVFIFHFSWKNCHSFRRVRMGQPIFIFLISEKRFILTYLFTTFCYLLLSTTKKDEWYVGVPVSCKAQTIKFTYLNFSIEFMVFRENYEKERRDNNKQRISIIKWMSLPLCHLTPIGWFSPSRYDSWPTNICFEW